REVTRLHLAVSVEPLGGEGDGGSGGVATVHDVTANRYVLWQADLLGELIDDANVGLVRDEGLDVIWSDAGSRDRLERHWSHLEGSPLVDAGPFLEERGERLGGVCLLV